MLLSPLSFDARLDVAHLPYAQAGARENINNQARARAGKAEVVRLENHQRLFRGFVLHDIARRTHQTAAFNAVFGPELEGFARGGERGADEHGRFQIMHRAAGIQDVIAVGVGL